MRPAPEHDVEALLDREQRARLPLARQLCLYLDPFSLFKNASCGGPGAREQALSYNRAMRWVLVAYLRRWIVIAVSSFLAVLPAEALAAEMTFFIYPAAAFAVGCCVAITVVVCTAASYLLLSR